MNCPNCTRTEIRTENVYPPIPVRYYDWSAYCGGCYEPGLLVGHGATEQAALDDLQEQWGEARAERLDDSETRAQRLCDDLIAVVRAQGVGL